MTLEERLHSAATDVRAAVHTWPPPLQPPPRRGRGRPLAALAALAAAGLVLAAVFAHRDAGVRVSVRSPLNPPAASQGRSGACPSAFELPCTPAYLPNGFNPVTTHVAHSQPKTDFIEAWSAPGGVIEVLRGADIPEPETPTMTLTVLGHPARFGALSDGYTVTFSIGDPASPCDHWALVAHPATTAAELAAVAEHLRSPTR